MTNRDKELHRERELHWQKMLKDKAAFKYDGEWFCQPCAQADAKKKNGSYTLVRGAWCEKSSKKGICSFCGLEAKEVWPKDLIPIFLHPEPDHPWRGKTVFFYGD